MPRIRLKPNSPEFMDDRVTDNAAKPGAARCEMPGCAACGEFRAPRDRGLREYYTFCLDHVREYNKAWNFFSGMAEQDIEEHVNDSFYGFRPTWRYDAEGGAEEFLRKKAGAFRDGPDGQNRNRKNGSGGEHSANPFSHETQEFRALAIMGLEPPITFDAVKARYRELVKTHHPDRNRGCTKSEELLKNINMAYTILKLAFEKYEKILESTT